MYEQIEKPKENKSQSASNGESQIRSRGKSAFRFVNHRPAAVAQKKLPEKVNSDPQLMQLRALQGMTYNSSQVVQRQITAEQVAAVAGMNPQGVSIDLTTGRVLTGVGYCVAYHATQNNHGPGGLAASMAHANGPNGSGIIGAWNDNGLIYYDSVKKYTTRVAAVAAAQREHQIAIYDLGTKTLDYIMDGESYNPSLTASRHKRTHSI